MARFQFQMVLHTGIERVLEFFAIGVVEAAVCADEKCFTTYSLGWYLFDNRYVHKTANRGMRFSHCERVPFSNWRCKGRGKKERDRHQIGDGLFRKMLHICSRFFLKKNANMTRKELVLLLHDRSNEQTIKLLRSFPTLLRDLYVLEDYEEIMLRYRAQHVRAYKQWSRDFVLERYGIGVNHFYEIRARVEWLLSN